MNSEYIVFGKSSKIHFTEARTDQILSTIMNYGWIMIRWNKQGYHFEMSSLVHELLRVRDLFTMGSTILLKTTRYLAYIQGNHLVHNHKLYLCINRICTTITWQNMHKNWLRLAFSSYAQWWNKYGHSHIKLSWNGWGVTYITSAIPLECAYNYRQ